MANLIKKPLRTDTKQVKRMIKKPLSEKQEEILEYIGKLYEENIEKPVKRLDLAKILHCSPALVNKLLESLEKRKLILHVKYGEIKLTDEGSKISTALIRKHRLSEALFVNLLGLDPSDAHEFACKFEHIMDNRLADRIEEVLYNPPACPHGNPIPSKNKQKIISRGLPISSFSANDIVFVSQIMHENTNFLKKLTQIGIEVGTRIKIIEISPVDGTFLLEINGKNVSLGKETVKNLLAISEQKGEL